MPYFRKKPVTIEAHQFNGNNLQKIMEFVSTPGCCTMSREGLLIKTPEGTLHVSVGDWVIKGTKGEFYPCKPDIFQQIYDVVDPQIKNTYSEIIAIDRPLRTLTDHIVNPVNDKLVIAVADEPGAGGACHRYEISGFDTKTNPSYGHTKYKIEEPEISCLTIIFQNGPIAEAGINGITNEALLAILIDRLRSFQNGPYACAENETSLALLEAAQHGLHKRTISRMMRKVEGTNLF